MIRAAKREAIKSSSAWFLTNFCYTHGVSESKRQSDALQLQDRDLALLRGLFESRVMTIKHIAPLYFGGSREAAKKRLQKIKAAGLIAERRRRSMNEPSVLSLTRKAFTVLQDKGILSEYPSFSLTTLENRANVSELTISHELKIMDVKAAFHAALSKSEKFAIDRFSTWPLLYQFEVSPPGYGADIRIKPDGFLRIHEKEAGTKGYAHECFLEVDRSSEQLDTLINKAVCYLEYYRTGGYAERNGAARSEYKDFPFRVLMVLKSAVRRNNLAERLAHNTPAILTHTWLTTLGDVTSDPLGTIWIQPKDYREVTQGTPFHNERPSRNFAYRHQPEREAFIESKIPKLRLLGD